MKRTVIVLMAMLLAASMMMAQAPAAGTQQPQAGQQPAAGQPAGQAAAQPAKKGVPQAKSQEEFKDYQSAAQLQSGQDLAAAENSADQFAAKYPQSDLRMLLYTNLMNLYQQQNNADKTVELGRKVLVLDPDNPVALVMVATVIAERTRETDLDKDERLAEATKDATRALQTVDNIALPANVTPQQAEGAKNTIRSMAYGALGAVASTQQNYNVAEENLRKSVDTPGLPPDPLTMLRLAVTLDHQKKYAEALQVANKTVEISQEPIQGLARQERDRLVKLSGAAPASGSAPAAAPAAGTPPAQPAPKPPQQ